MGARRFQDFRLLMVRSKKYVAVVFIILLSSTGVMTAFTGLNFQGENSFNFTSQGTNLTVSPTTLYRSWPYLGESQIQIYGEVSKNLGNELNLTLITHTGTYYPQSKVISNQGFVRDYVTLNNTEAGPATCILKDGNTTLFTFQIQVENTVLPILDEALMCLAILSYFLTLVAFEFKDSRIPFLLIPVYVIIAAFFGQRYDVFFMITTGVRYFQGVNPFVASSLLPPSLKWEYPPLFLIYSMFSYLIAHLGGLPAISNSSLNYPGTVSGFTYMAWRAYVGPYMLPYSLLIKVPMIAATLGVYFLLSRRSDYLKDKAAKHWLLNPYVLIVGIAWGQLDVLAGFFLLFSLIELERGKTGLSSIMCSVGAGLKIFPVFLLPGIIRESTSKLRDIGIFLLGFSPNLILYWIAGSPFSSLGELFYSRSVPSFFGIFTSNGVSWQLIAEPLGITSFPSLFLYVFVPFYVIFTILFLKRKEGRQYAPYIVTVTMAFFLTYNFVNPQYFIWIIPVFLLSRDLKNAAIFSLIPLAYIFLTYHFTYFINPFLSFNYFSSIFGQAEVSRISEVILAVPVLIAFANLYFILTLVKFTKVSLGKIGNGTV